MVDIMQIIASDGYIAVSRALTREYVLPEAFMIGALASEYNLQKIKGKIEDEWFCATVERIEWSTTLTKYKQSKAIENLKKAGVIEVELRGMPAKRYIRMHPEKIVETRSQKTSLQEVKKLDNMSNDVSKKDDLKSKNFTTSGQENDRVYIKDNIKNNNINKNNKIKNLTTEGIRTKTEESACSSMPDIDGLLAQLDFED